MEKGQLIGQGRTAEVFAWGSDRVLKLYQNWMPAVPVEREFAITRAAHQAGLPVPATEEMVELDGRIGIIFERIQGVSMLKVLESQPWKLASMSRQLAELHAHMHTCTLPPGAYTQRQQIERGLEMSEALPKEDRDWVRDLLAQLPDGEAVCHGDFHPDNVMMTSKGPVIIDWLTGTRGHPLGDVARTALLFQTGGLPPRIPFHMRVFINSSRALIFSVYQNKYIQLHHSTRSQINAWKIPLLAARLFEVENYPAEKELILRRLAALKKGMI